MRLRPLLRLIWRTYRAHAGFFVVAALVVVIPTALFEVLFEHGTDVELKELDDLDGGTVATLGASILFFIGATLGHELYAGMVGFTVVRTRAGRPRPSLREVISHVPVVRLMIADLLYTITVAIGIVAFILPGLVLATWFALVAPVIEIEDRRVRAAFKRSRALVRGHFVLVLVFVIALFALSEALTGAIHALVDAALGDSFLLEWLAGIVADLASTPIYGVAIVILTLELMVRKERLSAESA